MRLKSLCDGFLKEAITPESLRDDTMSELFAYRDRVASLDVRINGVFRALPEFFKTVKVKKQSEIVSIDVVRLRAATVRPYVNAVVALIRSLLTLEDDSLDPLPIVDVSHLDPIEILDELLTHKQNVIDNIKTVKEAQRLYIKMLAARKIAMRKFSENDPATNLQNLKECNAAFEVVYVLVNRIERLSERFKDITGIRYYKDFDRKKWEELASLRPQPPAEKRVEREVEREVEKEVEIGQTEPESQQAQIMRVDDSLKKIGISSQRRRTKVIETALTELPSDVSDSDLFHRASELDELLPPDRPYQGYEDLLRRARIASDRGL